MSAFIFSTSDSRRSEAFHNYIKATARLPLEHTRSPLTVSRARAALIVAIAFVLGVAATAWFVVLVKGGAL